MSRRQISRSSRRLVEALIRASLPRLPWLPARPARDGVSSGCKSHRGSASVLGLPQRSALLSPGAIIDAQRHNAKQPCLSSGCAVEPAGGFQGDADSQSARKDNETSTASLNLTHGKEVNLPHPPRQG